MKSRIISFIILISLCSCDNQKRQEKLISNNRVKYWDVVIPIVNKRASIRGYCFYKNGSFQEFFYHENKKYDDVATNNIFFGNDIVYDRSWKSLNDSFFILSKKKVRILTLTKDTFTFQLSDKTIVKLAASQNQIDILLDENPFKSNIIWDTAHVSR